MRLSGFGMFGIVCGLLFLLQLLWSCFFAATLLVLLVRLFCRFLGEKGLQISEFVRSYALKMVQLNILTYAQKVAGLRVVLYGDRVQEGEGSFLVISNHQSWLDTIILTLVLIKQYPTALCRYIGKKSIGYIPMLGWMCLQTGALVSLSRKWSYDKGRLEQELKKLRGLRSDFWVVTYPEGTRFSWDKKAVSLDYAKKNDLPRLNNVLVPRFKGFFACMRLLHSRLSFIYNATIIYEGEEDEKGVSRINLAKIFFLQRSQSEASPNQRQVFPVAHVFLEKISIDQVPFEEKSCRDFLMTIFENKEKLIKRFKGAESFGVKSLTANLELSFTQVFEVQLN
ncbi:Probable 1-acyl-sn-glycerol-3-phosphate acyltransferase 5 [Galdieria sulphuraria]|nr:Probable 1-acyl-sn-glycerol-3-phosphate acyltransferase 5 [Galdieria sulphuraria]